MNPKYSTDYLKTVRSCCYNNENEIYRSIQCVCFYCKKSFNKEEINKWVETGREKTAICPYCEIDAVISDASAAPIKDSEFVNIMHQYFFDTSNENLSKYKLFGFMINAIIFIIAGIFVFMGPFIRADSIKVYEFIVAPLFSGLCAWHYYRFIKNTIKLNAKIESFFSRYSKIKLLILAISGGLFTYYCILHGFLGIFILFFIIKNAL